MSYLLGAASSSPLTGLPDSDLSSLWSPQHGSCYHKQGARSVRQGNFFDLWPPSSMLSGDPNNPLGPHGVDACDSGRVEPLSRGDGGHRGCLFVRGQALNVSAAPLAGATIAVFLSATNQFVNQGLSDANGNYAIGTPYSAAHFVVAYDPGSPDIAGTSANNLIPS